MLAIQTRSPEETRILGASLAPMLLPGDVISLTGDLGAGKTVFVQGLSAALGVQQRVTSPTFTIVHEYQGRYPILHLDVYRLNSFQEVIDLGFEEFLDPHAIVLIEWGEAVAPLLPRRYLEISIHQASAPEAVLERLVTFHPRGPEWIRKLEGMRNTAEALIDAASPEVESEPRFFDRRASPPREDRQTDEGLAGEA
jgi:tRNA threonylcarbamoyladenosine biosynthesis protein TsaE